MAPRAPTSITSPSSSSPWAASVDAAFSVVSPGNTGTIASANTSKKTERYAQSPLDSSTSEKTCPSLEVLEHER